MEYEVDGARPRGRPKKTCKDAHILYGSCRACIDPKKVKGHMVTKTVRVMWLLWPLCCCVVRLLLCRKQLIVDVAAVST